MSESHVYLYDNNELAFTFRGRPLNPVSCLVTEERNGTYELEMRIEVGSINFSRIKLYSMLYVPHEVYLYDNPDYQPFDVYEIEHDLSGISTIRARHVSYRLKDAVCLPFEYNEYSTEWANLHTAVSDNIVSPDSYHNFNFDFFTLEYEDEDATEHKYEYSPDFTLDVPRDARSLLGGAEGSLLDLFGGEFYFNKFNVYWYANNTRGENTGITFYYGKNITSMIYRNNNDNKYGGVAPYWRGTVEEMGVEHEKTVTIDEGYIYDIYRKNIVGYLYNIIPLDLSSEFETEPSSSTLKNAAWHWIDENIKTVNNEEIDMTILPTDPEHSKASTLRVCDTVNVSYPELGIETTAKVTRIVYNVMLNRNDEITIGVGRRNLNTAIKKMVNK